MNTRIMQAKFGATKAETHCLVRTATNTAPCFGPLDLAEPRVDGTCHQVGGLVN